MPAVPIAILLILPFGPGPRAGERPADPAAGALCPVAAALAAVPPEAGHPAAEVPAAEVPAAASPAATAPAASHLPVPTEDPILDDLEHFRALGWWHGGLGLRPLSRGEVARAVRAISSSASLRDVAGGNAERLRRIRSRVAAWGLEEDPAEGEPSLARLELRGRLRLHAVASALDTLSDLDRRARREQALLLEASGTIGRRIFATARFSEDYTHQTPHRGSRGWSDNLPRSFRRAFTDATARVDRAVIGAGWSWGDVRLGREDRIWGAGRHGALFLGENPFPLDGIGLRARTRRFQASSLFGQLRRGLDRPLPAGAASGTGGAGAEEAGERRDAWLAAHRFEAAPRPWLRLGFYEAVAYGGRGLDLGYANPVGLLLAVTQDLDDRTGIDDKKVIGFDLSADLRPVTVYGELLINRIVSLDVATKGDSTEISSYAQLAGLRWADPFGLPGADLDVEYAHLDPEVYFHHDNDPGRSFLHEGELIGHWLGPNADDLRIALTLPPLPGRGTARLAFEQARWGVIDGHRGTALGFAGLTRREKEWITGEKEVERFVSLEWTRCGLAGPFGSSLDAGLIAAHVRRTGRTPGWKDDGWQVEARLEWSGAVSVTDEAAR